MKILEYGAELAALEDWLKRHAAGRTPLRILEAGCGREWYFKLDGVDYELTGLDIDEAALDARKRRQGDLHHAILGDLRTADLPASSYDVVYNAFVLEHIKNADKALENLVRWLRPGGLMIVRIPDRDSVHGFVTRLTPHWVHVLYYKWVWRMKDAGKPGFAPYRTIYDPVVSLSGLRAFCARRGLTIREELGVGGYARGEGWLSRVTPLVARMISAVTIGRIHSKYVDLTVIAQKAS